MSKTVCLLSVFSPDSYRQFISNLSSLSRSSLPSFFTFLLMWTSWFENLPCKKYEVSLLFTPWSSLDLRKSFCLPIFCHSERECQTCFCFFPFISFIWKQLYLQFAFLQLSFGTVLFSSYRASLCFKIFCSYCPGNLHSSKNYPSGFYVCCTGWILSAA